MAALNLDPYQPTSAITSADVGRRVRMVRGIDREWYELQNAIVADVKCRPSGVVVLVKVNERIFGWYSPGDVKLVARAWYYDRTPDGEWSNDPEGNLAWLCDECAEELGDQVEHAGNDALVEQPCWRCGL